MVYEFLKMEIFSDRYEKKINNILKELNVDRDIIINGDIASEYENIIRAEVLGRFRGYNKNEELFEGFPTSKIDWIWTVFDKEDIYKIKYINYCYWNELSNYTGSPVEAAKAIISGKTVYGVSNDGFIYTFQDLKNGVIFPPLIMLTDSAESEYIILEGHKRMTAYGFDPELFQNVSVLLGYCNNGELKNWYGNILDLN